MKTLEYWRNVWKRQTTPGHRQDTEEHYRRYAAELKLRFNNIKFHNVLELGCGNGALFSYLGFDKKTIKGWIFLLQC